MSQPDGPEGNDARTPPGAPAEPTGNGLWLESAPAPLIDLSPAGVAPDGAGPEEMAFHAWVAGEHARHREAATLACLRRCAQALGSQASLMKAGLARVEQEMPGGPEATVSALLGLSAMAFDAAQVERFRLLLAASFRLMQEAGLLSTPLAPPEVMGRLCASALRLRIEPQAVRGAILAQGIGPATEADGQIWPWPLRLQTLGRLRVVAAEEPRSDELPVTDKSRELLQRLVAAGAPGESTASLASSLWPEQSGSEQDRLLGEAVHRLGQWLRDASAVEAHGEGLRLNPRHCWCDAWTFERLTQGLVDDQPGGAAPMDWEAANLALSLYAGHFLADEGDKPWAKAYRNRLRERFLRLVRHVARQFEAMNALGAAASICERGLEVDATAEPLYQQLMICHLSRGHHAKALEVYRRCRVSLLGELGVPPSEQTEQLHRAAMMPPRSQGLLRPTSGPGAP